MKFWLNLAVLALLLIPLGAWAQEEEEWIEYTDPDEVFTLQHPPDWVTELPEGLVGLRLGNSPEALARSNANESLAAEDIAVQFLFLPRSMFNNINNVSIPNEARPDEYSQLFADLLLGQQVSDETGEAVYEFGEPEVIELDSVDVGVIRLLNTELKHEVLWVVYEPAPDLFWLFAGLSPELTEEIETTFLQMVNTLSVQADAEGVFQILLELQ